MSEFWIGYVSGCGSILGLYILIILYAFTTNGGL
jgi:hypothetical protein